MGTFFSIIGTFLENCLKANRRKKSIIDSFLARVEVDLTNELEEIPRPKRACYSQQCGPGSKLD